MVSFVFVLGLLFLTPAGMTVGTDENESFSTPSLAEDHAYVGEIRMFASELPPPGWLECDGRTLNASDHPRLYEVLRDRFGSVAAGEFSLPDLRGRFVRGWQHTADTGTGVDGDPDANSRLVPAGGPSYPDGSNHVGTEQHDAVALHRHIDAGHTHALSGNWNDHPAYGGSTPFMFLPGTSDTGVAAANIGGPERMKSGAALRTSTETRPSNVYVMFCIRDDPSPSHRRVVRSP